jgi:hypothetical protein
MHLLLIYGQARASSDIKIAQNADACGVQVRYIDRHSRLFVEHRQSTACLLDSEIIRRVQEKPILHYFAYDFSVLVEKFCRKNKPAGLAFERNN